MQQSHVGTDTPNGEEKQKNYDNVAAQEKMMKDTNDQINKLNQTSQDLQIRVTGKPLIREIKERVWEGISYIMAPRWDYFTLLQEQIDMTRKVSLEI